MTHQESSSTETAPRFDRWGRFTILAIMASVVGLWGVGLLEGIPCVFQDCTGLPCPFCGGTRAFATLAAGRPAESLAWHPLIIPGALVTIFAAAVLTFELLCNREVVSMVWWNRLFGSWVMLLFVFGIFRIAATLFTKG